MDIQKLHDWAKDEREKAYAEWIKINPFEQKKKWAKHRRRFEAFSQIWRNARSLLNSAHGSNHKDISEEEGEQVRFHDWVLMEHCEGNYYVCKNCGDTRISLTNIACC